MDTRDELGQDFEATSHHESTGIPGKAHGDDPSADYLPKPAHTETPYYITM